MVWALGCSLGLLDGARDGDRLGLLEGSLDGSDDGSGVILIEEANRIGKTSLSSCRNLSGAKSSNFPVSDFAGLPCTTEDPSERKAAENISAFGNFMFRARLWV